VATLAAAVTETAPAAIFVAPKSLSGSPLWGGKPAVPLVGGSGGAHVLKTASFPLNARRVSLCHRDCVASLSDQGNIKAGYMNLRAKLENAYNIFEYFFEYIYFDRIMTEFS
jgi:hypothetical protein